jgi:tetratricopeptide (TPR) repeat protein
MKGIGCCLGALAFAVTACTPAQPAAPAAARESGYQENNRGVAALEQYAYDKAVQSFRRAIALDDQVGLSHVNLAIALYYASQLDEAAAAAAEARKRLPNSPHAIFIQGLIARGLNRPADATAAFSRVLELDPSDAGAMISLGQTLAQERREREAIPLFRAAIAREPANATAIYSLGQALIRTGADAEGARVMAQFDQVRENGAAITYSQTYLEQGRYAEAVASTGLEPDLVTSATPNVSFSDQTDPWGAAPAGSNAAARRTLALADLDRDGDFELITGDDHGFRVSNWTGTRFQEQGVSPSPGGVTGIVAADLDNDERTDLVLLHARGLSLLKQTPSGAFGSFPSPSAAPHKRAPYAPNRSPYAPEATFRTAALLDVDHDGDLDVLAGGPGAAGSPGALRLLRNNGEGMLTDITEAAKLRSVGQPLALVPTDFDNRRDMDVLVLVAGGVPNLFQNQRDGSFRDVSSDVGLARWNGGDGVASCDLNKDGYPDFFVGKGPAPAEVVFSDGHGRFTITPGPRGSQGLHAVQCADYDNDGLLDIVGASANGLRVFRNLGGRFVDVTNAAIGTVPAALVPLASFVLGDIDGDGDEDIATLTSGGTVQLFRNDGGSKLASVRVRLQGRVSNRSAVGAKVDVRAGSLWQRFELSAVTPAVTAQDLIAGLGTHVDADAMRVLWPAGILQAETTPAASGPSRTVVITELNRKPSSCPFLYAWNGASFQFVTDFLGAGEMGYWGGAHGWSVPDGDEYVRLSDRQLAPRNNRLELRVTNELEEVLYLDHLQLLSIDHPSDVEVFPREGMRGTPQRGLSLAAVRRIRPLQRAVTDRGNDVTSQVARRDGVFATAYSPTAIRGYAGTHALILETGPAPSPGAAQVLLLTGWTDYAFSSDNVAAAQRGWSLQPPQLEIRRPGGQWRPFVADVGIPVGRPQTIVVDIGEAAKEAGTQFRLTTNMQIQWDAVEVADLAPDVTLAPRVHAVDRASLAWRGYSAEVTNPLNQMLTPDYSRTSRSSPWKVFPGHYTREGDVGALLSDADDLFVVARTGDEVALAFSALPPSQAGTRRTFLLRAEGYSKEMDVNSSSPDHVAPLPYRGLTAYPSVSPSADVRARQRAMVDRYNTRAVTRPMP